MSLFSSIATLGGSLATFGVSLFAEMVSGLTRGNFSPNNSEVLSDDTEEAPATPATYIKIKWRPINYGHTVPATDIVKTSSVAPLGSPLGEASTTYGSWVEGGEAEVYSQLELQSGDVFLHREYNGSLYNMWWSEDRYVKLYQGVEVDWADLSAKIQALKPLSENKAIFAINGVYNSNVMDYFSNGIMDYNTANSMYTEGDDPLGAAGALFGANLEPIVNFSPMTITTDLGNNLTFDIGTGGDAAQLNGSTKTTPSAGVTRYTKTIPMEIKVYFTIAITAPNFNTTSGIANANNYTVPNNTGSNAGAGSQMGNKDWMDKFKGDTSTTASSEGDGINPIEIFNGNSIIPYDSVYMTGVDYNLFVAAGGGIVAESGLYPNDRDTMYITKITLSLDGNSMTVIQNSDFDATALLSLNERVYGYIINSSGDYEASFCGFVYSMSRQLQGSAEVIVYECKCLKHYLSQITTPSYVIYQPPSSDDDSTAKTYDSIIKDIFTKIGLTNASITLPRLNAPELEYNYTSIKNVLEDLMSYLGNYAYYTTKNGILTIAAIDSGSNVASYRIPTRGEAVGTNKVSSFVPTSDMNLSRSRLIITGDYPIREIESIGAYEYPDFAVSQSTLGSIGTVTVSSKYVIDPRDCKKTGVFCYKDTVSGQYITYFMFRPGKTIVTPLVSNSEVSAEFIKIYSGSSPYVIPSSTLIAKASYTGEMAQELPIDYISTNLGNSFYYMYKFVRPGITAYTATDSIYYDKYLAISQRYCIREDEPFKVFKDTGYAGGVEVIKVPEFKKITSKNYNRDDTSLAQAYANVASAYYKPTYGGQIVIQGLENQLEVLDKVSITNTSLPTAECTDLVIHTIEYDLVKRETTLDLSNRIYMGLPHFDYRGELKKKEAALQNNIATTDQMLKYSGKRI